jgi:hypothetical protein
MTKCVSRVGRATVLGIVAAATLAATPGVDAAAAKATCDDRPYQNWTRVTTNGNGNVAGVVFRPKGDKFHIWDNDRDGHRIRIDYNYAGIDDEWKIVPVIDDGSQGEVRHNLRERRRICFRIHTDSPDYPNSPIVQFRTSK